VVGISYGESFFIFQATDNVNGLSSTIVDLDRSAFTIPFYEPSRLEINNGMVTIF
jgi:hypothetical protein